ncbi:MAG: L-fucose:H+ symporter permease [Bacteroidetes bacterium GWF2_42_66]|nr:MAG: L-fucose:H+ symporter permease [Bacteroidetes bacterium GWA2_42_15]OFY00580.1 MAG: L-fucose:H+ symporter permease [Bacteroidetes bacterium GWE2_42_39]OFY42314.1 MAG: L-fucose:H+ symporter permease [Bacteroidetes bacterium GWF2_42_66]HAZ02068.1 L-fucose:H+ symporter permease [Marinilabiliales bacterium]HBL76468.1 L-fucose:H+ symporter permease [Prolixibacteraceae bacterium]
MEKQRIIPKGIVLPFILLTSLFFAWAVPNNLTDTMLAAFKRIMSMTDSKTAWIQVACYLLGYGCFAIPAALFIKKYTYKSGVMLGLGMYALGTFLFYPAMLTAGANIDISFFMFLLAIVVLFAGLSILETATNSYVCAIGPEETATQRLNFSQSFNPFGAITGVVVSQVFILSQLNTMSASERAALPLEELGKIQAVELNAVTMTYVTIGLIMVGLLAAIYFTRMPNLKEDDKRLDFVATFRRLMKNKNYVWAVVAQFFYVGAQIAVWSFVIRYVMQQLQLDSIVQQLGENPSPEQIITALRSVEPVAASFYNLCEWAGLDGLLPQTTEQAGASYYIISLVLFVIARFVCTGLMRFINPRNLLTVLSALAVICCFVTIYAEGSIGVYALMGISGCMSLMFPTIYGLGIAGLGNDTKIGGAGMVMAIAGAAVLTQIQGIVSDQVGSIKLAYWVPAFAFVVVGFYGAYVCCKRESILL